MSVRGWRLAGIVPWAVAALAGLALSVPASVLGALTGRRQLRAIGALLRHYVIGELRFVAAALRPGGREPERLWAALGAFAAEMVGLALASLGLRLSVEAPPDARAALADRARPVLVFCRHAGTGDSAILIHLLLNQLERRPSVVMKETLAMDPVVGIAARHLPQALIDQSDDRACDDISALTAGLAPDGALVLFPEGGNFSAERRRSAIRHLRRRGQRRRAARAERMHQLLPPRPGGVLAALAGADGPHILFCGHRGLGDAVRGLDLLRSLPHDTTVTFRFWLADPPPDTEAARIDWIDAWWARLDAWIAAPDAGHEPAP